MTEQERNDLRQMLERQETDRVRELLAEHPAPTIAEVLAELPEEERATAFRALPPPHTAEVFAYLDREQQRDLLAELPDPEVRQILADLSPDDRTALFADLPADVSGRLFTLLSPADAREVRDLLGYPAESVGRLMTPDFLAIRPEWTVADALTHIRRYGHDSETVNMIYVIDDRRRLLDDIRLRRLILAQPETRVSEIMDGSFAALSAYDDREKAVTMMRQYDLVALPVLDADGVLLGIVTVDDVFDVAEEEVTEDMHKVAAIGPLRTSYRQATVWTLFQRRFYWLAVLVVVNLASSGVIAAYEDALEAAIALAFFIPLLIDSGGNSGSQAATMMIRALVIGEIRMRDWARTLVKELGVGLLLGVGLAILAAALGLYRGGPEIGLIVGLSMIAIIVLANLIGMTLPFVLSWLRVDPAAASSPLVTTLCDVTGLLIYFAIASRVLAL